MPLNKETETEEINIRKTPVIDYYYWVILHGGVNLVADSHILKSDDC